MYHLLFIYILYIEVKKNVKKFWLCLKFFYINLGKREMKMIQGQIRNIVNMRINSYARFLPSLRFCLSQFSSSRLWNGCFKNTNSPRITRGLCPNVLKMQRQTRSRPLGPSSRTWTLHPPTFSLQVRQTFWRLHPAKNYSTLHCTHIIK